MQDINPGGFTPYSCQISAEAKAVFERAMEGFIGVDYEPIAVATQVVNGINYSFLCNSKTVVPNADWQPAIISISDENGGKLKGIRRYEPFEATY